MKIKRFLLTLLISIQVFSQQELDENIQQLMNVYSSIKEINCEITVDINVDGMRIPQKIITVNFEEGKKPKVKGKGLALLPKKGMINQFNELFSTPLQAIFMGKKQENLKYKLVSLDNTSKWVTADLVFDPQSFQIYESVVNTRKQGTIYAQHSYVTGNYPEKSIITFDVKKFKVPLRFIGRENQTFEMPKDDEQVQGKIILQYKYLN